MVNPKGWINTVAWLKVKFSLHQMEAPMVEGLGTPRHEQTTPREKRQKK